MKKIISLIAMLSVLLGTVLCFSCCTIDTRHPSIEDWVGNIFQIVTYDENGDVLATGTGVVIHNSGDFITNAHVLEDAFSAEAIFEIEDTLNGTPFTYLKILDGYVYNENKDIFIGRVERYYRISDKFKVISFTDTCQEGETTYSIGYPNSVPNMEIHKGEATRNITSLADKLAKGSAYVGTTSYMAPGSSGGVLVNTRGEIIGITSRGLEDEYGNFLLGGAITYKSFKKDLSDNKSVRLPLLECIYGDYYPYIRAYLFMRDNCDEKTNDTFFIAETKTTDWGRYVVKTGLKYDQWQLEDKVYKYRDVIVIIDITQDDGTVIHFEFSSYWYPSSGLESGLLQAKVTYKETLNGLAVSPYYHFLGSFICKNGQLFFDDYTFETDKVFKLLGMKTDNEDLEYLQGWCETCYNYALYPFEATQN